MTRIGVYYPNMISQAIFVSYAGEMTFSLSTDASVVKRPSLLTALFVEEVGSWAKSVDVE